MNQRSQKHWAKALSEKQLNAELADEFWKYVSQRRTGYRSKRGVLRLVDQHLRTGAMKTEHLTVRTTDAHFSRARDTSSTHRRWLMMS